MATRAAKPTAETRRPRGEKQKPEVVYCLCTWAVLNEPQRWLDLFGFLKFQRAWSQKVIELKQEMRGGQLGTMQLLKLDKWVNQYARDEMQLDKLTEALIGFLLGQLPEKFKSKEA